MEFFLHLAGSMKGLVTILVFVVLLKALMPAMNTAELARLPFLFEHFKEHRKSNQRHGLAYDPPFPAYSVSTNPYLFDACKA